jgi:hypothetical protein
LTAAEKILAVAAAEIGVKENPANSNRVKYNTEYYGNDIASSKRAWCCAFVWWVFKHADLSSLFYGGKKCAGCTTLMNYYKAQGQLVTGSYRPGDLVFFQFDDDAASDHIGIIEKDNGDTISTIEGNTAPNNDANGGAVMRRTRKKSLIMAVARPKYPDLVEAEPVTIELDKLKKGSKGDQVKALQTLLIAAGYSCGKSGADGVFGSATLDAVKAYQKANGLTVDGIVGQKTWSRLLGA